MKKNKLFILMALAMCLTMPTMIFLGGCQKEDEIEQATDLLDLNVTNLSEMSSEQKTIFEKASAIINDNSHFSDGRFVLDVKSGKEIGMSEDLFNFFVSILDEQNQYFEELESKGYVGTETEKNKVQFIKSDEQISFMKTRSYEEEKRTIPSGGLDGVVFGPTDTQLYLSRGTIEDILSVYENDDDPLNGEVILYLPSVLPGYLANAFCNYIDKEKLIDLRHDNDDGTIFTFIGTSVSSTEGQEHDDEVWIAIG